MLIRDFSHAITPLGSRCRGSSRPEIPAHAGGFAPPGMGSIVHFCSPGRRRARILV